MDYARIYFPLIDLEWLSCPTKIVGADPTLPYSYLPTFDIGDATKIDYDFINGLVAEGRYRNEMCVRRGPGATSLPARTCNSLAAEDGTAPIHYARLPVREESK